ncbi:MAG: hypothetical protein KUG75_08010 [Pseudomonadales bacterium]|nr:hypothetical protein [Pseudomonadales bacterium]
MTNWRDQCRSKLVTAAEAVGKIKSGDTVSVAPSVNTPFTLCRALVDTAQKRGLKDIRIEHMGSAVQWTGPVLKDIFTLRDNYSTPLNREACHAGETDYLPIGMWKSYEVPYGLSANPNVFMVPVSPPNKHGYCSFGQGVWTSPGLVRGATLVIAEVREEFIRTYGENYVHIDQIDFFVEGEQHTIIAEAAAAAEELSEEEISQVEAICTTVAVELINDGDTIQMGVGTVSASLGQFLDFRNDLGIQAELITGGVADLVRRGVITGRRKTLHPGKVVASAIVALAQEELDEIHENPVFELYDFCYTDDLRHLITQKNFVAVNNAMVVDLTGQVSAEAYDHRMFTGVGGQTVFMFAGAYSPGGKSVSVVPSSSVPKGSAQRVSRIVPTLTGGTPVTVPRTYIDYVVTEFGVAELRGKTVKERANILCEIAHPEFREELKAQAKILYGA